MVSRFATDGAELADDSNAGGTTTEPNCGEASGPFCRQEVRVLSETERRLCAAGSLWIRQAVARRGGDAMMQESGAGERMAPGRGLGARVDKAAAGGRGRWVPVR